MLRGPQTPGELKARAERLHPFASLDEVEATLERLDERGHVRRLERRPGQKEVRYAQLLGAGAEGEAAVGWDAGNGDPVEPAAGSTADPLEDRLGRLEAEVAGLRESLERLRGELGA
jgi:uncharacterized protein YceH (UPF0502 family)